jgi:predicted RNase H-like nuclease (RuvC/YqgF family)
MDKIEDKIQYETSHFNKNINEYKSQNENLNYELNRLNNQYLKLNSKTASIKQIQLNL